VLRDSLCTVAGLRTALASSRVSADRLAKLQERRLKRLLLHAYEHVRLYRSLYDENGFHPADFGGLEDLRAVPVLTKERLKTSSPAERVAEGIDSERCRSVATSGSTGIPLRVYLGPYEERLQRVAAWRILFEHGFRWRDRTLEIRHTRGPGFAVQKLGIAPKTWLSILDDPAGWAAELDGGGYQVVVASASTLELLAEAVLRAGAGPPQPRIVISDSESLTPTVRALVSSALGTDPVDVYGLVELSNFAWQCEQRRGFHVSADSHLVEVEVDGTRGDGPGLLIATELRMRTMPIIRYRTGDLADAAGPPCPCGRTLPLLPQIYGRAVDSITLPDGQRLLWPFFHEVLGALRGISRWRVVQETRESLRVEIVALGGAPSDAKIVHALRIGVGPDVSVAVARLAHIRDRANGKQRLIVPYAEKEGVRL